MQGLGVVGQPSRLRVERCACGGEISAPADDPEAIVAAVHLHVRSARHMDWARACGERQYLLALFDAYERRAA
jgi:hypothetical protein